jgi:hypothetical protein
VNDIGFKTLLEVISKMGSQNNTHASEMYKAEEVFDVKFVSSHQATEVVQPCEQSLNSPAMPIPAQLAAILSSVPDAVTLMWCDHVDTLDLKLGIQPIAVVSAVANQSLGFGSDKALLKGSFDKGDLMRRSRRCVDGDRNTSAVCHCHELRTLAPLGLSHCAAPFLAPTKVPSMKHCAKSSLPRFRKSSASASRMCLNTPASTQYWNRRWQVWYDAKRSGKSCHAAPERNIHRMPLSTWRSSLRGLPRPSVLRCGFSSNGSMAFHCSSFNSSRRGIGSPQHELR